MQAASTWRVFAVIHRLLMLLLSACWVWSQWGLYASVGAMSDQLVAIGTLDPAKVDSTSGGYSSIGNWLMQGHDGRAYLWGLGVCGLGVAGSLCMLRQSAIIARKNAFSVNDMDNFKAGT